MLLKPSPADVQEVYLESLGRIGIDPGAHDTRFVEDNWEAPTLGAWGTGWEVWLDGMEITQFTYFQQAGGIDCDPVSVEITYGLERLAMYLFGVDNVYDLEWAPGVTYGDVHTAGERQFSAYNFEAADVGMLLRHFDDHEREAGALMARGLPLPAYDQVLKCSHAFNLLDARGAISRHRSASATSPASATWRAPSPPPTSPRWSRRDRHAADRAGLRGAAGQRLPRGRRRCRRRAGAAAGRAPAGGVARRDARVAAADRRAGRTTCRAARRRSASSTAARPRTSRATTTAGRRRGRGSPAATA